jgi:hypothetical protein
MKFQLPRIMLLSALLLGNQAQSLQPAPNTPASADWPRISKQLEEMLEVDQATRKRISALMRESSVNEVVSGKSEIADLREKLKTDDSSNLTQLKEIVSKYGWPRKSLVGAKAALGAFLVLQHSEPNYQADVVPFVREAVAAGEADKSNLALLEDRILVRQGMPQIYGSQVSSTGAFVGIFRVKDESNLDKLRAEVGLEPICTYLKRFVAPAGKIEYPACSK